MLGHVRHSVCGICRPERAGNHLNAPEVTQHADPGERCVHSPCCNPLFNSHLRVKPEQTVASDFVTTHITRIKSPPSSLSPVRNHRCIVIFRFRYSSTIARVSFVLFARITTFVTSHIFIARSRPPHTLTHTRHAAINDLTPTLARAYHGNSWHLSLTVG